MSSNSFGKVFTITTWGESHGKAIGVVIDGCPAGIEIHEDEINAALSLRAPGCSPYTSPRKEPDRAEILSGTFEGQTTGAPISIIIPNQDADSSKYEPIKNLLRPGHANYTYLEKYGVCDYRGGGRSSGRETACRVAAGAIAAKLLQSYGIQILAYLQQVGNIAATIAINDLHATRKMTHASSIFCPDPHATSEIVELLEHTIKEGDSIGGLVEFIAVNLPTGLGDPIYDKLEATLGQAMLSIPASKGFEIGTGFGSILMKGSTHNDAFIRSSGEVQTKTNHAGGILGGISNGMPLHGRVAFKPSSSILIPQNTLTTSFEESSFQIPTGSRHDPCVAIRAVPVVEAMLALVLVDALLMNRCAKL